MTDTANPNASKNNLAVLLAAVADPDVREAFAALLDALDGEPRSAWETVYEKTFYPSPTKGGPKCVLTVEYEPENGVAVAQFTEVATLVLSTRDKVLERECTFRPDSASAIDWGIALGSEWYGEAIKRADEANTPEAREQAEQARQQAATAFYERMTGQGDQS